MGWWGRGGEPARPSWAVGCPVSLPPSHSSSQPSAIWGGVSAPRPPALPQPPGRAPCRPMAAQGWQGEGSGDRSGGVKLGGAGAVGCWRPGQ